MGLTNLMTRYDVFTKEECDPEVTYQRGTVTPTSYSKV